MVFLAFKVKKLKGIAQFLTLESWWKNYKIQLIDLYGLWFGLQKLFGLFKFFEILGSPVASYF